MLKCICNPKVTTQGALTGTVNMWRKSALPSLTDVSCLGGPRQRGNGGSAFSFQLIPHAIKHPFHDVSTVTFHIFALCVEDIFSIVLRDA
jgi:hypothetical protein